MSQPTPIDETSNSGAAVRPKKVLTRALRTPGGAASGVIFTVMVLLGALAPFLAAHSPDYSSLQHVNAPIGTEGFPLGGNAGGRDTWARLLASINVSIFSGLIGTVIALILGVSFGLAAGYIGRKTDAISSWVVNLLMAVPTLVILIVLTPLTGGRYEPTMAILGIMLAPSVFRLVRNLVVGVRNELYVDAARVSGLSNPRIISRHVLYVIRGPIIIQAAFLATICITLQAGLAFLGIGTQVPSFGAMISRAFGEMYHDPLQLVWPTLGLTLLMGSLVLFGNAYRDALAAQQTTAPRRRRARKRRVKVAGETIAGSALDADLEHTVGTQNGVTGTSTDDVTPLLRVRDLSVSYLNNEGVRKEVVHRVSFDVGTSEIVGMVGESGSGKSQTAFAILGLLPSEAEVMSADISLAGVSLLDKKELRRRRGRDIAYIPQEPMSNLDPSFTVGSQLTEGLRRQMSRSQAKATVLELLERVGIPDPKRTFSSYPHQLSGGMAQRVLIAGAVATRPKLLIADEPTTALDVTVQAEILDLLRELQREYQMGVLLVTHNFGVVADICERVVMRDGELIETADVRRIFRQPAQAYTRELIEAILSEEVVRDDQPAIAEQVTR